MNTKVKVAILGAGSAGQHHAACFAKLKSVEVTALCDCDPEKKNVVSSFEQMNRRSAFDVLDICLPTSLHAEYAIRAMKEGHHVLCESPIARDLLQANRMVRTARETDRKFMVLERRRFSPAWNQLRNFYTERTYGNLLSFTADRYSSFPKEEWHLDGKKNGGALLGAHFEDVDFIHWIFGMPLSLATHGFSHGSGGIDELSTSYEFRKKMIIRTSASWLRSSENSLCCAVFQKAVVEIINDSLIRIQEPGQAIRELTFEKNSDPCFNGISYFMEKIRHNVQVDSCMPNSSRDSLKIAMAEEHSAGSRRKINITSKS